MSEPFWTEDFCGAITVCDAEGIILQMNEKAAASFAGEGGKNLIGSNVLDCHPEPARSNLKALLAEKRANVYTIQKKGVRKLVYQAPWYRGSEFGGLVEMVLELPEEMPHFNRDLPK